MECLIGIDLGGTQLRAALLTRSGAILAQARCASLVAEGPAAVVARIGTLVAQVLDALPVGAGVAAIGLGAPGPLDPQAGVIIGAPNMPGWNDVPLRQMVAAATGMRVVLGNDADAAALGEWRFGAGRGYRHLVYLTVSTGIGGGVIADGKLLPGRRGAAGELGFLILDAEAGICWEDLASGTALAKAAAAAMPAHPRSLLHRLATPETVGGAAVSQAARAGDPLACALMDREARLLGAGLASILHIFSPEIVLLGGSVMINNPDLLPQAAAAAYRMARHDLYREVPIVPAALGDQAGVLGAAALVLSVDGMA
ncbi:MAG: ROK family protein [Oscillochloris sp.]|nr:ROK family protein [Oscillochloris sp.]